MYNAFLRVAKGLNWSDGECRRRVERAIGHSGYATTGISVVRMGAAGDKGKTRCPHNAEFELKGGSSTVFINGKNAIRIADAAGCTKCDQAGQVESGSKNVLAGD